SVAKRHGNCFAVGGNGQLLYGGGEIRPDILFAPLLQIPDEDLLIETARIQRLPIGGKGGRQDRSRVGVERQPHRQTLFRIRRRIHIPQLDAPVGGRRGQEL